MASNALQQSLYALSAMFALAAPVSVQAQGSDMLSDPFHPFNPVTDPYGIYEGAEESGETAAGAGKDEAVSSPDSEQEQDNTTLYVLLALIAGGTAAASIGIARQKEREEQEARRREAIRRAAEDKPKPQSQFSPFI